MAISAWVEATSKQGLKLTPVGLLPIFCYVNATNIQVQTYMDQTWADLHNFFEKAIVLLACTHT